MTTKQNGKQAPFQIGQKVHHISADRIVRTVLWVSKGATSRADQVIVTDYGSHTVEANIYVEAA
jgi:hypothetical protein